GHISGYLQFSYNNRIEELSGAQTEEWDFEQRYKLRYSGYTYHPRLLNYSLSGTFNKLNGEITPSDNFESKATDYDATLNFLSITPFPFSLYASRSTALSIPFFTSVTTGYSGLIEQRREVYGLSGSLDLRGIAYRMYLNKHRSGNGNGRVKGKSKGPTSGDRFLFFLGKFPIINYKFEEVNRLVEGAAKNADERTRTFNLNFKKGFEKATLSFNYQYANKLDRLSETTEKQHSTNLGIMANLTSKLRLSEEASYYTNSLRESAIFSSRTRLYYLYSPRLRIDARSAYENKEEKADITDTLTNSVTASYARKLAKNIAVSGAASVNHGMVDSNNTFSESVSGSLSYSKILPQDITFSASTAASLSAVQGDSIEEQTFMSVSAGSSLSKGFRRSRTRMSAAASYFYSWTSLDEGGDGYNLRFDITNNYIKRLTFKSTAKYLNENFTDERDTKQEFTTDTTINYFIPLGRRGKGALIAGFETSDRTNERRFAYGKFDLWYAILRNLTFKSSVKYSEDLVKKQKILYTAAGLNYWFRQVVISMKYEFYTDKMDIRDTKRQYLLLRLTRYF
ncbi:MAG: hypothetical protein AB1306_10040, partial [Nitrospirota bacterium]